MTQPRILRDIYSDLRDRRLLPVVAVLLVAIVAVPLLLKSDTEMAPPSAPPPDAVSAESVPTLPAVLASNPGLRDYRKRLDALRSKNPFAQKFSLPAENQVPASAIANVAGGGASGAPAGGSAAAPPVSAAAGSSSAATPTSSASTASGSATSPSTGGGSGSGGGGDGSIPESGVQFYTYRIDVVTGRAGDTERRKNVKRLTVLPSQSNPVALFLGVAEEGKRASFLVSTDVIRSHGDGGCSPSPADCQLLTLRVGDERKFQYAPRGEEPDTYVIHLKDILVVPIEDPRRSASDQGGRDAQSAQSGLEAFLGL